VPRGTGVDPIVKAQDSGATYSYVTGVLPPGLALLSDGTFDGAATENGIFKFDASVCQDTGVCTVRHVTVRVYGITKAIPLTPVPLARTGFDALVMTAFGCLLIALGLVGRTYARREVALVKR
jgi:hypothetical protein